MSDSREVRDLEDLPYTEYVREILNPDRIFEKPEPLKGIRVVEIGTLVLGPMLPTYLAEFGAEVIKVELPGIGDTMRALTPFAKFYKNLALGFEAANNSKYHVSIDLRTPEGKELMYKLVKKADVLVENFRPGTTDRWGLGYRQLSEINPGLVYISMSGFGQWGPFTVRPSYDAVAQATSGLMETTGFKEAMPLKVGDWIGDYYGALIGAFAVMVALYYRQKTGKGQYIDLSQAENLVRNMDWTWLYVFLTGKNRERTGNRDVAIVPSDIVRVKDGYVAIAAFRDEEFRGLCEAMHRYDLYERYADIEERQKPENQEVIYRAIHEWAKEMTVGEIEKLAEKHGFAAVKVMSAKDQYEDEHWNERKAVWKYEDPLWGELAEVAPVPKLSESPGRIKWTARPLGFDNEYVFIRLLGLSIDELRELYKKGVIGKYSREIPRTCPPDDWDGKSGLFFPEVKVDE
ncbi:CaiB/BaiF CoA transferase family protein [Geoglobus sp.]